MNKPKIVDAVAKKKAEDNIKEKFIYVKKINQQTNIQSLFGRVQKKCCGKDYV